MKYFNPYYIAIVCVGILLCVIKVHLGKDPVAFYGFAENKETEINFNYAVAVADIMVQPGEFVRANTPLVSIYRIRAKEVLEDEPFEIAELEAKETIWKTERENDIKQLQTERELECEKLRAEIQKLVERRNYDQFLYEDLQSLTASARRYTPISDKITALQKELSLLEAGYEGRVAAIRREIALGESPYKIAIDRLKAEQEFQIATEKQYFEITAPTDGVIGNIHCKEAEHIPSFRTLVTFYEPNPTIVKGYVHEDLSLNVAVRDSFIVRSTKNDSIFCYGEVIGLGSRIVAIPERLRKVPALETYGREVLVSIPADNRFLQKEKVILEFVHPPQDAKPDLPNMILSEKGTKGIK